MKIYIVVTDVVNDVLRIPAKVLIHVWSYDFYDMTLPTGKQQRHMIKQVLPESSNPCVISWPIKKPIPP